MMGGTCTPADIEKKVKGCKMGRSKVEGIDERREIAFKNYWGSGMVDK